MSENLAINPTKPSRERNWSDRIYYVIEQDTERIVADNFSNEKECIDWIINSDDAKFETFYIICYRVKNKKPIKKTQKTILKSN